MEHDCYKSILITSHHARKGLLLGRCKVCKKPLSIIRGKKVEQLRVFEPDSSIRFLEREE